MKTRYDCPGCGKHKIFSRYLDTQTGEHLRPSVGRCNRESNCGYHYTPKQYFEDNPDSIAPAKHFIRRRDRSSSKARACMISVAAALTYQPRSICRTSTGRIRISFTRDVSAARRKETPYILVLLINPKARRLSAQGS